MTDGDPVILVFFLFLLRFYLASDRWQSKCQNRIKVFTIFSFILFGNMVIIWEKWIIPVFRIQIKSSYMILLKYTHCIITRSIHHTWFIRKKKRIKATGSWGSFLLWSALCLLHPEGAFDSCASGRERDVLWRIENVNIFPFLFVK